MGLPPSANVTVPVGVPLPGATADTVAVNVTGWPKTEGLAEDVTVVDVSVLSTVRLAVLLLVACTASAGYAPVIVCGLTTIWVGVTVVVQVEAVAVLGARTQAPAIPSVASDEDTATVPSGLNEGEYSCAS